MLPISVVVSLTKPDVDNCLGRLLQELRQQTVPPFEKIVVGHDSYQHRLLDTILGTGSMLVPILDDDCTSQHALSLGVAASNCSVVACLNHDASPLPATWLQGVAELFQDDSIDLAFPESIHGNNIPSDPCQAVVRGSLPGIGRWRRSEHLAEWAYRASQAGCTVVVSDRVAIRPLVLA